MGRLEDLDLFVRVVRNSGLAAAGREVGLSPASMTARMNGLEERYGTRLLNRTTRRVAPTEDGARFYDASVRILADVREAEARLESGRGEIAGPLRVTAPSDVGRQHVDVVLTDFVEKNPAVQPHLHLGDSPVDLADAGFDVAVRYGSLPDTALIARRLAPSKRVLCASPAYLERRGAPDAPEQLAEHDCLAMVRGTEPLTTWHFEIDGRPRAIAIEPARSSNDGAVVRRWALDGHGIALKSFWDIARDLAENRLVTVLDDYATDFDPQGGAGGADLRVVYPSRRFMPVRVRAFVDALVEHFARLEK